MTVLELFMITVGTTAVSFFYIKLHEWFHSVDIKTHGVSSGEEQSKTKHMDDIKQNIKLEALRACAQKQK